MGIEALNTSDIAKLGRAFMEERATPADVLATRNAIVSAEITSLKEQANAAVTQILANDEYKMNGRESFIASASKTAAHLFGQPEARKGRAI